MPLVFRSRVAGTQGESVDLAVSTRAPRVVKS